MSSAVDDATIPMEVDAAPDKPLTLRSRSGVSAAASSGAATGKGRGRAGRRSAAGAGGAAGSAHAPAAPAPSAPLWSAEEHAAVVASLWRFGVGSVSADQSAAAAAASASNDGVAGAPVPSARAGSLRLLQAHPHTIASVSSKSAAQVSEYVRLLVWEACAAYLFAAPLLHAAGAPGHKLNGSFVRELIATHDMQPPNRTDAMTPQLATGTLYIPSEHSAAAAADAPLVAAQAAPPAATEHTILSRWIGRLRRLMLLGEITRPHCAPDTPSIEADAAAADSSAAAAVASPSLAALAAALQQDAGLCYDATALDVLPRAQWGATDDALMLTHAVKSGYGALPPAVADLPAAMVAARLDFVLDEFHAACLARSNIAPVAPVAPVAVPPASPTAAGVPLPPSLSAPVWTGALVRQVVSVLTTHGLPVLSFAAATAAAAASAATAEPDKPSAASASSDWVCPACPLLDWSALFALLIRHTGQVFDERWQGALSALLVHLSADFEQCALSSDRATLSPDSAAAAAASNLLLPPASLQSFRRSLLFFHNLRVRILDPGFHGFADDNAVLEWVSQFAPGLPPPTPAQEAAVEAAVAASAASAPASVPTVSGSALTAMAARSDGSDFARISSNGGASLHCLSDSAAGLSVPGGSVIPDWWQIGFHDLCLLRSVHRWGVELDEQFWQTVNRDIQRPAPSAAASASTADEAAIPAAASTSEEPLSSLSWCDEGAWLAHSRPIILHRMSDPQPAAGPLPPPEPLQPRHRVALLRRVSDLVASMSAIATDEFVNSLLSSVQAPAPASEATEVKKETEGAAAADAATPAVTTAPATPASASASAASPSPYPAVTLSQSASFSLRYFSWSLCGYSLQEDLWSLLKTRWHELVPSAQMQAMEGLRAAVLGTPASVAAAAVPSRKRRVGVHTSAAAARATMAAWGLIPADEVTGPENPLKLSDAAFLRPTPGSLSCVRGPGSAAASSTAGETGRAAFVALGGRNPATEQGCKRQRVDAEGVAMLDDEADDATASDQTMQGCESKLAAMLEAQQRQAELAARLRSLHGDAALPPTHALAAPFKVLVDRDARLVLPQRLCDGMVVHQLGALTARSLGVSQRATADRAARAAMRAKRHSDGADSPAQPPAPQPLLLFPEGYVAAVRHQSYVRVDTLAQYTCEIVTAPSDASAEASLLFRLTASDDPSGRAIEGPSAQAVWDEVCARVLLLEEEAPLAQRQLLPCDGAERFGLTCTAVAHALAVEIAADPSVAQAVESTFGAAALQAHYAALPRCQFYLCEPVSAAAVAQQSAVNSALESEWSQQHLRLHRLALSVLAADRAEQVAVTSAQQQLEAQAAQAAQAAQVHAAAVLSTSSEAAVQAQAQAQAQLHAQAQQAAAVAQAQQQHLIRQRMEEEMAAAAAAAVAGVGMPMYGGAAAAPATQAQVASYSYVQPYAMQSAAPYGAYAVAMPTDAQQMYSAHHAAVQQQQQQQQQQQAVHLAYMQQQQQQQQNNYNIQSMQ